MFGKWNRTEEITNLDPIIAKLVQILATCDTTDPQFPKLLVYLERLETLKLEKSKAHSHNWMGVNPDTVALVGGNLLGILVIVAYEQRHVMGSKALSLLLKFK